MSKRGTKPRNACRLCFAIAAFVVLTGCEQIVLCPRRPPKWMSDCRQQTVTRFLEATATPPIKSVDLVAGCRRAAIDRLQGRHPGEGRRDAVHDRARNLQLKLEQAQAAEAGRAGVGQAGEADFKRQSWIWFKTSRLAATS